MPKYARGSNTSFIVSATGSGLVYQWQVDNNLGGGFVNLSDVGVYSGTNTPILGIFNAPASMDGYLYRAVVSGTCAPPAESAQAVLTVNTSPVVTLSPDSQVVCVADNLFFEAAATGTNVTYQWQVSIDGGIVYFNLANDAILQWCGYRQAGYHQCEFFDEFIPLQGCGFRYLSAGSGYRQCIADSSGSACNHSAAGYSPDL
jgi:hypothetical protein